MWEDIKGLLIIVGFILLTAILVVIGWFVASFLWKVKVVVGIISLMLLFGFYTYLLMR